MPNVNPITPAVKFSVLAVIIIAIYALSKGWFWRGLSVGFLVVYVLKYGIVGLDKWDAWFHPERRQADDSGPYNAFSRPFLQGVWNDGSAIKQ